MLEKAFSAANHFIGEFSKSPSGTLSHTWRGIRAETAKISEQSTDAEVMRPIIGSTGAAVGVAAALKLVPLTLGASLLVVAASADHYLKVGQKLAEQDNRPSAP